jgi:uncharacterized protein (TIGR02646 family)
MRKIQKQQPPADVSIQPPPRSWGQAAAELKAELESAPADERIELARNRFDGIKKSVVREALGREQDALCIFCERRVDPGHGADADANGCRIAPWKPLSALPAGALDWRNVYLSCNGKWGSGASTCDQAQGDKDPLLDPPAERDWGAQLHFNLDGRVWPTEGAVPPLRAAIPAPPGEGLWLPEKRPSISSSTRRANKEI